MTNTISDTQFGLIKTLIKERCGLVFEDHRETTLRDGIMKRFAEKSLGSFDDYIKCLTTDDSEAGELVNLITINETYFFREPAHIDLLVNNIVPSILSRRGANGGIKIISAGCSTGEEAYSISMALHEAFAPNVRAAFTVIGFDIDEDALRKAKEGQYSHLSFRSMRKNLMEKYFDSHEHGKHTVRDFLKSFVDFRHCNLVVERFPERFRKADVVFYRNVSIYFEPETQMQIFKNLADILNEDGYLIMSSTETYAHDKNILKLTEMNDVFLFQKSSVAAPSAQPVNKASAFGRMHPSKPAVSVRSPHTAASPAMPHNLGRKQDAVSLFNDALELASQGNFVQALSKVNAALVFDNKSCKGLLLKSAICVNLNHLDEARRMCMECLDNDKFSIDAYLILGLLLKLNGDAEGAVKRFKEALYLQPSCWPAHFNLAEIYKSGGIAENAVREYEITARLIEKNGVGGEEFAFFQMVFPIGDALNICSRNLSSLRGASRRAG